ncbi:MAG: membrane protein insertion efficiency factor YidD, partial [candidate division Zixibacteria bacterium]|nr:membrane protein insertion efficiency factor YidD [candidate division Zixibacteria bacterium]
MLTLPRAITYALVAAALSGAAVHPESVTTEPYPFHRLVTSGGIKLYQKLVSPARGSSCPMHPRCSEYSRLAFRNRNPLQAYLMTADRLLRCGHDLDQYSPTVVNGYLRYSDPVDEEQSTGGAFSTGRSSDNQIVEEEVSQGAVSSVGEGYPDSTQPDELLFRFAIQLHNDGEHDRAITEYRRLMAYYPNSPYRLQAEPL